ncbi:FkbM family methyltransferase [Caballeronia sp. LjRoot29]|uniref:FkbM family methyltransferase n=1 Tax=Caballeronia sp. LjRoot29 TaxID=3342315 RepID=UPI003ED15DD1
MQLGALHAATASVQYEVLVNAQHWHDTGFTDAQRLSLGLHQNIQVSRESVREEVLRSHDNATRELQAAVATMRETMQLATDAYITSMSSRLDRIEDFGAASARRVAVHSDHDTVLVKTPAGYVLCADSDHAVLAGLIETGDQRCGVRLLIQEFLEPGDTFVDVGAHLGLLSLAAARAMHGRGKIFVFEPFPGTRSLLERSFRMNGFADMIEVHGAAVSNRVGETTLFLGTTSERHSLIPLDLPGGYMKEQIDVPSVTLDSALPSGQAVNLLKIDAGGAELDVIEGARSLISGNPNMALIVELSSAHLKRAGHSLDQWFEAFAVLGLIYFAINPDTGVLENVPSEQLAMADSANLFFARPDSLAWKKLDLKA